MFLELQCPMLYLARKKIRFFSIHSQGAFIELKCVHLDLKEPLYQVDCVIDICGPGPKEPLYQVDRVIDICGPGPKGPLYQVDRVIDICGPGPKGTGLQNLRECIIGKKKFKFDIPFLVCLKLY